MEDGLTVQWKPFNKIGAEYEGTAYMMAGHAIWPTTDAFLFRFLVHDKSQLEIAILQTDFTDLSFTMHEVVYIAGWVLMEQALRIEPYLTDFDKEMLRKGIKDGQGEQLAALRA